MAGRNLNTKFVRSYWESRLSDLDCADRFGVLSLIEEAYNLGRDDLSYEMLMSIAEITHGGKNEQIE